MSAAPSHRVARRRHDLRRGGDRASRTDEREVRVGARRRAGEVAACERELSRFDPASDLSRLNAAGGRWTPVGRRLLEALDLALRAREDTGGRFDPTVLPALVAAGYDRSFELLEERPAAQADGWRAGAAIELDERRGRARLEPGSAVDLGGIGKGYAAGRALDAMRATCAPSLAGGLVDLGGDIAVSRRVSGRRSRGGSPSPIRAARARRSPCSRSTPAASRPRVATPAASARPARSTT